MSSRAAKSTLLCAALTLALGGAGCGEGEPGDPGAGNPESELSVAEATVPLEGAAPELVALREQANEILDGGLAAFRSRLAELRGIPVVVNKWASWCGPCREEFPFFQSQAIERANDVAFLGLLTDDGRETGATFLEQLPLPYPSYLDEDQEIAGDLNARVGFPSTVFFNAAGEPTYTKIGPYPSEESLAADIDRHASPK